MQKYLVCVLAAPVEVKYVDIEVDAVNEHYAREMATRLVQDHVEWINARDPIKAYDGSHAYITAITLKDETMRFNFTYAKHRMEHGECARRQGWPVSDMIVCRNTIFYNADTDKVVELSDEDKAAEDWIVYRKG